MKVQPAADRIFLGWTWGPKPGFWPTVLHYDPDGTFSPQIHVKSHFKPILTHFETILTYFGAKWALREQFSGFWTHFDENDRSGPANFDKIGLV